MAFEDIVEMIKAMGLPFAYHHYAEGESPDPPFLLYLTPGSNNFSADGKVYFKAKQLDVELYTDKKMPELEEKIEKVLDEHGVFYEKNESYIESEKMYEVLYEMEV